MSAASPALGFISRSSRAAKIELTQCSKPMFKNRYARWMYDWETRLTRRDENRVVRPREWGFEWIEPFLEAHGFASAIPSPEEVRDEAAAEAARSEERR